MLKRKATLMVTVLVLVLALGSMAKAQDMTKIRLQLKWVTQAQFAGYYAAAEQGYFKDEGLDVEILPGGPEFGPQQVVAAGGAEIGLDWLGSFLAARDQGAKVVVIAQVFQRSGMREVMWKDSGLETIQDLKGKTVGVWGFGNEFPLKAALVKNGIDPDNPNDITIFTQPFDMVAFLNREIDAAAAMTYNELAQVLEFVGEGDQFPVYTLDDLNVIDLNKEGTAMLEDLIFTNEDWLAGNQEAAVKFLRASFRGWAYCRDNSDDCVSYVLKAGSQLGKGHQTWMMNEINKLVWPSPNGIGLMDDKLFQQTAEIALNYKVIEKEADGEGKSYTNEHAQAALDGLAKDYPDLDLKGEDWEAATVEITPNGE